MPNKEYDQESLPHHKSEAEAESKRMAAMNEALSEPDPDKRAEMLKKLAKEAK